MTLLLIFLTLSLWTDGNLFAQQISINVNSENPTCSNSSDGSIDLSISGGSAPYSYSWEGPNANTITTQDLNNLVAGSYTVTVTDDNSLTANKAISLNFVDNLDPDVQTQNITVYLDAAGKVTISEDAINDGSTDACGINSFDTNITEFDCSNIGSNVVILTVTDVNGNTDTATATVTVEDSESPTANAQNISVELDSNGQATITAEEINDGSTDNCSISTLSLSKTDFVCNDVGSN
ncbi:SprB repeat-containing protein, partial [Christiangramia echinicola]|uniref:SprB repeat-containing protein n=1 Tax=Christiangramia echinicola TaxID=279359 RepID=UPI001969BDDC